jgi:hypothetical protein
MHIAYWYGVVYTHTHIYIYIVLLKANIVVLWRLSLKKAVVRCGALSTTKDPREQRQRQSRFERGGTPEFCSHVSALALRWQCGATLIYIYIYI